ncbi:MAG: glycosyltransferase [Desulfobacterales bacterium]|nr:glycosyltransferase [Desulfobacterales bacterium]
MKFTIITPSYNSQRFIRETIESVINQKGNFTIEYFILDKCSTDQTKQIVSEYINSINTGKLKLKCNKVKIEFISDKDSSMYDAIQKGFTRASGDIYAWINSDDIYLPGAFDIVQKTFSKYQHILWLKGITAYINENSNIFAVGKCNLYLQNWITNGVYGPVKHFIQQDSVFWRAELWNLSGGLDPSYSAAGDFVLWRKFAKYAPLWSLNCLVSCFRKVVGQKSEDIKTYWQEVKDYNQIKLENKSVKRYFLLENIIPRCLCPFCFRLFFGKQQYHLVTLEDNLEPCLREGNYYKLRKTL